MSLQKIFLTGLRIQRKNGSFSRNSKPGIASAMVGPKGKIRDWRQLPGKYLGIYQIYRQIKTAKPREVCDFIVRLKGTAVANRVDLNQLLIDEAELTALYRRGIIAEAESKFTDPEAIIARYSEGLTILKNNHIDLNETMLLTDNRLRSLIIFVLQIQLSNLRVETDLVDLTIRTLQNMLEKLQIKPDAVGILSWEDFGRSIDSGQPLSYLLSLPKQH